MKRTVFVGFFFLFSLIPYFIVGKIGGLLRREIRIPTAFQLFHIHKSFLCQFQDLHHHIHILGGEFEKKYVKILFLIRVKFLIKFI